jgi:hypothetical protein
MTVQLRLSEEQYAAMLARRAVQKARELIGAAKSDRLMTRFDKWVCDHPNATPRQINYAASELLRRAKESSTREG